MLLDAALEYAKLGYYVYPVSLYLDDRGKKRVEFPGPWQDSSRDESMVRQLFAGDVSGIAIDTGKSGIVVLDIDVSHGKNGLQNLHDAGISLPSSPTRVHTWSGGFHGYFRQPEQPIGSGSNRPVRDVDVRGLGGVVFAPPTLVIGKAGSSAGSYQKIGSILPVDALPILHEGYASRLRAKPVEHKSGASTAKRHTLLRDDQVKVIQHYLENDLECIRMAGDGERNEALGRTTILLADRCLKLGFGYEEYLDIVLEAYLSSGGEDQKQATDWVNSSWKKAQENPLVVPRTYIDEMADKKHAQLLAQRLANARIVGASSRWVSADSFVDWSSAPPPASFWVDGIIPQGEQVILFGRPESGKTFLSLDWAMSVATGYRTWGRRTRQGKVWFMAGEGNARITSRIHAWIEYHGITPDPSMMRLLNHVPDLMNEQIIESMAQKIAEDEIDLVVIDTLGRAMSIGGGDISDPRDAAIALRSLQALAKYRTETTPVAIHHPVKDGGMAGAYNLLAGVDVALVAEVDYDQVGTLKFHKNKDGEKSEICRYAWHKVGPSAVLVPAYGGN